MAGPHANDCGCCSGVDTETPTPIYNVPGQAAIAYRAGRHAKFKESLLTHLSDPELGALAGLTTRDDDDFTIALCDALSISLDVLTFYQERIANESFLRTSTERRSILELAALIGYELAPGVAASTHLAFNLQEVPGSPQLGAEPVDIPAGTRVQSVPGPGEKPQTFETVEVVDARTEWNAIPVQAAIPWRPGPGDRSLWLSDLSSQVQQGDTVLIVGQERLTNVNSVQWAVRVITEVTEDKDKQRTRLTWKDPLGQAIELPAAGAAAFVFRQRAAIFGHNAVDPKLLDIQATDPNNLDWDLFELEGTATVDLDSEYPKIVPGGWVALLEASKTTQLYRALAVEHLTLCAFALSSRIARVHPDALDTDAGGATQVRGYSEFGRRTVTVLAQSEQLPTGFTPLAYPLFGSTVVLSRLSPGINPGRTLAVTGKPARVRLRSGEGPVTMAIEGGGSSTIGEGQSLRLASPPEAQSASQWVVIDPEQFGDLLAQPANSSLRLRLIDSQGRTGVLEVAAAALESVPAEKEDGDLSEIVKVGGLAISVEPGPDTTLLQLSAPLIHCYDRPTVRVNANVARATHGESANEVVGSGNARVPNMSFPLSRTPLTYVSAATPGGRRSTLEVRVNDLIWTERDSLYGAGPRERVFETRGDAESRTTIQFGDGVEGARPPSGDHNVRASYRHGIGLEGNVPAGKLTNLLSRPLGVSGAVNPAPAGGAEDPEAEERARTNAPLTVLTIDRAVSVLDYRNFARGFAGIAKAHALWIPAGPFRGVFLTVAGEKGAPVAPAYSDTYGFLQTALRSRGDSRMPIHLHSYRSAKFRVALSVKVMADADATLVLPAVESRLRTSFSFEARDFGQGTSVDEVTALAQSVPGVEAVHVRVMERVLDPTVPLFAQVPVASLTSAPLPAELLTLETGPLQMDLMP